jgi:hypothetical protein
MISGIPALPQNTSLVCSSLQIGKLLIHTNSVQFKSDGTCMFPVIHPKDILLVNPCEIDQVKVGDIAVCRKGSILFSHRIVKLGMNDIGYFIDTKSDCAKYLTDGYTYKDNFLGIVWGISRNGKIVTSISPETTLFFRLYRNIGILYYEISESIFSFIKNLFTFLQRQKIYTYLGNLFLLLKKCRILYEIHIPSKNHFGNSVYQKYLVEKFASEIISKKRNIDCFILVMYINNSKIPAVSYECTHSMGTWEVTNINIAFRYRGLGLEDKLLNKLNTILSSIS